MKSILLLLTMIKRVLLTLVRGQRVILFDCDDTLVESETLAFNACCQCVNDLLARKGAPKKFDPAELKARFVGRSFRYMCEQLSAEYNFQLTEDELKPLVQGEQDAVIELLRASVEATPGIRELLSKLRDAGYLLAVVSSSALPRVKVCLQTARLAEFFGNRVYSAQSLNPPTSKPNPAIYLYVLKVLKIFGRDRVFAVEDSTSGILAAVRAGIPVVAYLGTTPESERGKKAATLLEAGACAAVSDWKGLADFMSAVR